MLMTISGHRICLFSRHVLQRAVIDAMVAMLMVDSTIYEVVYVVTVRYGFMTTTGTMNMVMIVPYMVIDRMAAIRVFRADFDNVFIDVVAMRMV